MTLSAHLTRCPGGASTRETRRRGALQAEISRCRALLAWPLVVASGLHAFEAAARSETNPPGSVQASEPASQPGAEGSGSRAPPPPRPDASEDATSGGRPLAVLPEAPSIAVPDPDPNDLKALDGLLGRLTDGEPLVRERAVRELLEVKPRWTAAVHNRLDALADRANKVAMKDALQRIRSTQRKELRAAAGEAGLRSDLLDRVVEQADPESETWRHLVHALALSRMLRHIGTTAAARSLVHVYVRYGEFLRVNTQLELEAMGDQSLPALIEARRHAAQKIAQWAERQLDLRGKAIAGEALRTDDPQALSDILRAFGRIRDPDAARIIISFAQSERAGLREAAREALVLLGEVATWQLRDAYESTLGKRAPREWTWQRTARELFTEFDRQRQAEEHDLFEAGLAAHRKGDLEAMLGKYDRVLAFNPMFERRDEMAAGYLDYARKHGAQAPDRAASALRRAERVSGSENERRALQSLRQTFEARRWLERDIADQGLIHQALALDPNNRLAEETLATALAGGASPLSRTSRYWGAAAIAGVSLLGAGGILWVGARRRRSSADGIEPIHPPPPPEHDPSETGPSPPDELGEPQVPGEPGSSETSPSAPDELGTSTQSPQVPLAEPAPETPEVPAAEDILEEGRLPASRPPRSE